MSILSIRLSAELNARLSEESEAADEPKSLLARRALAQFLARRKRERLLAKLSRAAAALDPAESSALADEALRFDNEALALTEGGDAAQRGAYRRYLS